MDYNKLIERLHQHDKDYGEGRTQDFFRVCLDCKEAATALSTLQTENEKLRADAVRLNDLLASYQNVLVPELRAELEQVKAERDAAVSDIENALAYGLKDCELCVNSQCYVRGGTKPCLPKWRGPKKED